MEPPRDSSDICIGFACPACSGFGGHGSKTAISAEFNACSTCAGTGWVTKRAKDLTPAELARLLLKLPSSRGCDVPSQAV